MNDEDLISMSIGLRRKLHDDISQFWIKQKDAKQEQIFFINSVVMASLIAQIVHAMFKKDIEHEILFGYIDRICNFAKKQLSDGSFCMGEDIQ